MPYVDKHNRICGFVDVEELENSGKFYRRYAVMDPKKPTLCYYMDNPLNLPDGTGPVGEIDLSFVSKVSDASKLRPKTEFCFVINSIERKYYFQANDKQDLVEWIEKLNNASRIIVDPNSPHDLVVDSDFDMRGSVKSTTSMGKEKKISYRTEVVGGVVVQTPIHMGDSDSDSSDVDTQCHSLPPRLSPTLSKRRHHKGFIPIKEGFCVKQGAVMKSWKRRYFVLDDNGLSYYKAEHDKDPIRTIHMRDIFDCRESSQGTTLLRDNLFELVTVNRTFYIQADSPEEMQSWISSICGAIMARRASSATNTRVSYV
ncbi:pleckstrin homology domain-containing family A member 1-like isoform X1 [Ptychodera flava]|uniref:pleckstrin homology domain-containing family A member 1-like isoform X1 n=1 Tax=Ptychodera flava TaxID=63121 RepID=UPI00396A0336